MTLDATAVTALIATAATPAGPFTVVAVPRTDGRDGHAVLASGWTDDPDTLLPLVAPSLRPQSTRTVTTVPGISASVTAYHEGDLAVIDEVSVTQRSGPFLNHAWDVLRSVPAGTTVTYTELAAKAGRPSAVRAAGSACSKNAAALFVPCHRVLPAGGGVGGFRWGSTVKSWLLEHEDRGL